MSRGEGVARTGAIVLASTVVGAAANFALAAVVGRGLGPAGTGTFFAVVGAFVVAANVLELGADTGLVRGLARHLAQGRNADLGRTIAVAVIPVVVIGVLVGVALFFAADGLSSVLGGAEDREQRAEAYRALAPFVLAGSLVAVLLGGSRGMGQIAPLVAVQSLGIPLARLVVAAGLVSAGYGVVAVLQWWAIALPAAVMVAACALARKARAEQRQAQSTGPRPTREIAREFWGFSAPRAVAAAVEITLEWVDVIVVAVLLSPREAGIYAIVTRLVRVGQMVEHAARVAVAPQISALAAIGEIGRLTLLYRGVTRALIALAMPFYLLLIVFAPTLLGIFGEGFAEGQWALRIAAVGMLVALSAGALQTVILMAGRSSWQLQNKSLALVTATVLLFVLVPMWGINGAAAAASAAIAVDTARAAWQARSLGVTLSYDRTTLRIALCGVVLFAGLASMLAATLSGPLDLGLTAILAGPVYLYLLWRWRASWLNLRRDD